jgi:hypothetical protein
MVTSVLYQRLAIAPDGKLLYAFVDRATLDAAPLEEGGFSMVTTAWKIYVGFGEPLICSTGMMGSFERCPRSDCQPDFNFSLTAGLFGAANIVNLDFPWSCSSEVAHLYDARGTTDLVPLNLADYNITHFTVPNFAVVKITKKSDN